MLITPLYDTYRCILKVMHMRKIGFASLGFLISFFLVFSTFINTVSAQWDEPAQQGRNDMYSDSFLAPNPVAEATGSWSRIHNGSLELKNADGSWSYAGTPPHSESMGYVSKAVNDPGVNRLIMLSRTNPKALNNEHKAFMSNPIAGFDTFGQAGRWGKIDLFDNVFSEQQAGALLQTGGSAFLSASDKAAGAAFNERESAAAQSARAGGGFSFLSAVLLAVAVVAIAAVAAEMIAATELATADIVTNAVVESAIVEGTSIGTTNIFGVGLGETGGFTAIFGSVPTATFAGAVAVNQAAILFVECVTGFICGSDGNGGNGVYNVAAGTVSGGVCYGPANSCGQAYKGTYEQDPATAQMGCKIEDSFTYGAPADSECGGPAVDYFRIKDDAGAGTTDSGGSVTLEWSSSGASYCKWTGSTKEYKVDASGTFNTGPLTQTSTYKINCANANDIYGLSKFVTVTVLEPDVSISADHPRVKKGDTAVITWSGKDIQSCAVSDLTGTILASGVGDKHQFSIGSPYSTKITTQSIFKIACQTNGGPITRSVTVNVVPSYGEF
jgi:hypothetical protein